eukprot:m.203964 g.203964  ORF g.203964 m.203964 type:complete len:1265 (+) comp13738_c0_seq1:100-3894(+)
MSKSSKLPNFISSHLSGTNVPSGASREFCNLIKAIGESGTNHEEGRIIAKEAKLLEKKLKEPSISKKQMKEYLVRLIYCEMLGRPVPFGYIHAVKFTQHTSLLEKRMGYLAVSALLHADHELIVLLVNTMQRDLKSSNIVELCMSLISVCKLINAEMIPAVLEYVTPLLSHNREIIRKKAILAMHRFYLQSPSSISHLLPKIRRCLFDQDPGVMAASLNLFYDMIKDDGHKYKDLVSSFVSILKQVIENRLPKEFNYHRVPAPWVQMKLLRILAILGADDRSSSESMYEVLRDCLQRADVQSSAAYAVVYECAITCTKIYPSSQLVELAAKSVGRFLRTDNNNLKYLGITALASIVTVNPAYARAHKALVIECLDDPDETLKRKTLDLLCKMTNPANVKVIVEKLLGYLKSTVDTYLRKDLVPRIIDLAERFAPDNIWYVETINTLFLTAGDLVDADIAHNLMRLIAEGSDEDDEEQEAELRSFAAESYINLLEEPSLPDVLVQTIAWVVGEYAYVVEESFDQEVVLQMMSELLERSYTDDAVTKSWIVSGISKLISQTGLFPNSVRDKLLLWQSSAPTDLQQRCSEVLALVQNGNLMRQVLPLDASCEDIEVDADLSFLDGLVNDALGKGALPYQNIEVLTRRDEDDTIDTSHIESTFNFTPYDAPKEPEESTTVFSNPKSTNNTTINSQGSYKSRSDDGSSPSSTSPATLKQPARSEGPVLQVASSRWRRGGDVLRRKQKTGESNEGGGDETSKGKGGSLIDDDDDDSNDIEEARREAEKKAAEKQAQEKEEEADRKKKNKEAEEARANAGLFGERKELAESLFATVDSSKGPQSPRSRRRGGKKSRAAKRGAAKSTTTSTRGKKNDNNTGDLLSLDDDEDDEAAVNSFGKNDSTGDYGGDLMDLLGGPPLQEQQQLDDTTPSVPPPSYDSATSLSSDPLDLLAFGSSENTTKPEQGQEQGNTGDDLMSLYGNANSDSNSNMASFGYDENRNDVGMSDLMGDLDLTSSTPSTTTDGSNNTGGFDSLLLPSSTSGSSNLSVAGTQVASDQCYVVTFTKELGENSVSIDMHIYNMTKHVSSGLVMKLEMVRSLQRVDEEKLENRFSMNIAGEGEETKHTEWVASSLNAGLNVKGDVTYLNASGKRVTLPFRVPMFASDFIRPASLTTDEFGGQWQQLTSEQSSVIPSTTCASVEAVSQRALEKLRLQTVQIIGNEIILAGKVLVAPIQTCLVHLKLELPTVYVSVKSNQRTTTDSVLDSVKGGL